MSAFLASLRRIVKLSGKELRSLRADPILLAFIFYVFTVAVYQVAVGVKFEVEAAKIAVVDEDKSEISRQIRAALLPPLFQRAAEIEPTEIDKVMDRGEVTFVIEIPPQFESDLLSGKQPSIQINIDATAMALAGNGAVDLENIIAEEVARFLRHDGGLSAESVNFVARSKFNPNLKSLWFTAVMQVINNIAILSIILTGAALIREREHGTIEHLLVMPVTPLEIMLSKIFANGLVIVAASMFSLLTVVRGLLGAPLNGSLTLFLVGASLFMCSVTALGLLLATYARTMPQFGLLALPTIVILYLLSGSTTPLETMPLALQWAMSFTPNTQFVAFAQGVLYRGAGLDQLWPHMLALAAMSLVTLSWCRLRFVKTMGQFSG